MKNYFPHKKQSIISSLYEAKTKNIYMYTHPVVYIYYFFTEIEISLFFFLSNTYWKQFPKILIDPPKYSNFSISKIRRL